ncbi:MAG: YbfB/YjiJ family MFS transporter [Magnetospirillum sp. WYHS-4]
MRLSFHYGWAIVAAGTLTVFAAIGLGRFALGMLLPSMGQGLDLSYAEMGFLGTANFLGYLGAVMVAGHVAQRFGARAVVGAGLFLVAGTMILMGAAGGFAAALLLYAATGVGSGFANVPIMGLVSHWFGRGLRGKAAGLMIVGNGLAIVTAGQLVPWINGWGGAAGWRWGWAVLGAIALLAAAAVAATVRNDPGDLDLEPLGGETGAPAPAAGPAGTAPRKAVLHLGAIYFLFGATYSVYVTFIVTTLVKEQGFPEDTAGAFWAWVGFLSLFSGPVFGTLSDRTSRRTGLIAAFLIQALAYGLASGGLPGAAVLLSVSLFGFTAFAVPTIMAAAVGDTLGPARAAKAFGLVTVFFGAGQVAGPAVAGLLAEASGSFAVAYGAAAAAVLSAALLALFLKPAERDRCASSS